MSSHTRSTRSYPRRDLWSRLVATPHRIASAASLLAFVIALVLGGSRQAPLNPMVIEIGALIALFVTVVAGDANTIARAWLAIVTGMLVLLVVAIEIIPLSYRIWAALPGHSLAAGARAVAKLAPVALPISLDPYATVDTALAVLPGLAMFVAGLTLDRGVVRLLAACIVLAGVASTLLGALQVGGGTDFYLYPETQIGYAVGLFANRNQQADLLLIAILFVALLARGGRGTLLMGGGVAVLLVTGVVTAGSRTGLVLLVPVLLMALAIALLRSRGGMAALVATVVALLALAALAAFSPVAAHVLSRFQTAGEDGRFTIWSNTLFAIRQYWPIGSGLGTFETVYATVEPLDQVVARVVNHAHDDYLEIVLELGLGGVALIFGYLATLGVALVRNVRRGDISQATAGVAILELLAHSLVDYPLRMPALMAIFGLLNGIVFRVTDEASNWNK